MSNSSGNHTVEKVYVIFKTHLDVGFTDFAHKVVERYFMDFIPQAVHLATTMQEESPDTPFNWTIGSWLVYEYLERATPQQRQAMERAIEAGYINWLAVPFTTHTEMMNEVLFRSALGIAQRLDQRFGRKTISAKMTDVPGHTRAMVPLLAQAGVQFLHIGVNPAATVPAVPPIFEWRDEATQTSIMAMYQQVYGDTMRIPGTNEAVSLVFTGDNLGPPSRESIHQTYTHLRETYPNAEFTGASLDDIARALMNAAVQLPVVTAEIGDTWIQGVGSDPTKVRKYRELLRLRTQWEHRPVDQERLFDFDRQLIMIPEHTWGMDLKTHLDDYVYYETAALAEVRNTPNFKQFELSWHEQRGYIDSALKTLEDSPLQDEALAALAASTPQRPDLSAYTRTDKTTFETEHWQLSLDPSTGAINHLQRRDHEQLFAGENNPIGLVSYETFSTADYDRYWHQYIRDREFGEIRIWAHPDNTKPNLQVEEHRTWHPVVQNIYHQQTADGLHLLINGTFPEESKFIGAPSEVYIEYLISNSGDINVQFQWFDKPACRLPEAFWMTFNPPVKTPENWRIEKLGQWVSPLDVISNGGRTLHAFDRGVAYQDEDLQLLIESLDAPLVAPGKPSLLNFHNQLPDLTGGMHFNLYNNVWGTNFTMWFDDDANFRFHLAVKDG